MVANQTSSQVRVKIKAQVKAKTAAPENGVWFIVPAAGIGQRMGITIPKQYLPFASATVIEATLNTLLKCPALTGIVVAIHPDDIHWASLSISQNRYIHTVVGGDERADSVQAGLEYLRPKVGDDCWVLVHDAARPCITLPSINCLVAALAGDSVGGILGVSCSDTLKLINETPVNTASVDTQHTIIETIDRSQIWQAQTPQMFRYGLLSSALTDALQQNKMITDEASALELAGYSVRMVEGRRDNIKITQTNDLPIAEVIYQQHNKC
ncbi:MAG: 2-C-methyl-D-erythritol 4-phosphate cytidylyltransferase [Granulosicoccus sp.]|jgi:2-C-methyl-D-erythritol 4-phosphate cytidylyltransferase